ncbi:MAG: DNA adenine methylase [Promethearchaeota archaeon]
MDLTSISVDDFLLGARQKNNVAKTIVGNPHPFLKWAGGKRQLLSQLSVYIPKKFNRYIEPFTGGGALFFYLLPDKATLIDNNQDLINVYKVIKTNVNALIESLKKHVNNKEYYYEIRNLDRNEKEYARLSDVEKASRIIYMNRVCYNGLYRVNKKNQFNVPFGKYKNPKICDEENLRAVNVALQGVNILSDDFSKVLDIAEEGDFVYFDPPYVPLSKTAYFTSYTNTNFSLEDQQRLRDVFQELDARGCKVLLSNSYNEFVINLYKGFRIETIKATRAINCDAKKRGKIDELVILNY